MFNSFVDTSELRTVQISFSQFPFQNAAANAIRNVVSRSRDLGAEFLAADAESLLRAALATHPKVRRAGNESGVLGYSSVSLTFI